jgi:hypothetical protein
MCGSLIRCGTLPDFGSLLRVGTLALRGSLTIDGTLAKRGSLSACGTLKLRGSLLALHSFGTLPDYGLISVSIVFATFSASSKVQ